MIAYVFFETSKAWNATGYTTYKGVRLCHIDERADSLYESVNAKYRRVVALRILNALRCELGIIVKKVEITTICEADVRTQNEFTRNEFTRLYKDVTVCEQIV